ncbi:flagellar motor protein MotB [Klebsiella pneumoniae]
MEALVDRWTITSRIIVKRVKRHAAGHHGGSWKIAFADFATAMMAFFQVLWLLSSATPEQKKAISDTSGTPSVSAKAPALTSSTWRHADAGAGQDPQSAGPGPAGLQRKPDQPRAGPQGQRRPGREPRRAG